MTLLRDIARRLRGRPDSEHEMSLNRLVFALLILLYFLLAPVPDRPEGIAVMLGGLAATVAIFAHILRYPAASRPRRLVAQAVDFAFLSAAMAAGGSAAAFVAPIFLWVIFGNGFRFGLSYLFSAAGMALAAFSAVVAVTPFWRDHASLSAGVLAGMVLLPLYAGRLVRRLSQAGEAAERARRAAEAANESKTLFLASVSHELRTPLTAIVGMGDLLRRSRLDHAQAEMVDTSNASARALLGLIDEILVLARIESGRQPVEPTEFSLPELLREAMAVARPGASERGLGLHLHIAAGTPEMLRTDRNLLRRILINLLGNAVKFTSAGEVSMAVAARASEPGSVSLRIEVADTGIGISPEEAGRIFEMFTQANGTIASRFGGTGIGLATCRSLVGLLGGEIGLASEPGAGSMFHIELPAALAEPSADQGGAAGVAVVRAAEAELAARLRAGARLAGLEPVAHGSRPSVVLIDEAALPDGAPDDRVEEDGAPAILVARAPPPPLVPVGPLRRFATVLAPAATPEEVASAIRLVARHAPASAAEKLVASRRLRVLVVDDNRVNQRVLGLTLTQAGHAATTASDGNEALDLLVEQDFDIVLMDLNMPGLDGRAVAKELAILQLGRAQTPVLALTADAGPEVEASCREAGMVGCLTKPFDPELLLSEIERLVPAAPPAPTGSVVDALASHPRFRPAGPALDAAVVEQLEALGGPGFVADLVQDFVQDGHRLVRALDDAALAGDIEAFRASAHALRSGAANLGARALFESCQAWRGSRSQELSAEGPAYARRVAAEIARLELAVQPASRNLASSS